MFAACPTSLFQRDVRALTESLAIFALRKSSKAFKNLIGEGIVKDMARKDHECQRRTCRFGVVTQF